MEQKQLLLNHGMIRPLPLPASLEQTLADVSLAGKREQAPNDVICKSKCARGDAKGLSVRRGLGSVPRFVSAGTHDCLPGSGKPEAESAVAQHFAEAYADAVTRLRIIAILPFLTLQNRTRF